MTRVWPEGAAKRPSARPNKSEFGCNALPVVTFIGAIAAPPHTPENVRDAVDQLFAIYEKNAASPSAQEDIKIIFG